MKLRDWQRKAIKQSLKKYASGETHQLIVAVPGAGKTTMAAVLTSRLFEKELIDYVVCLVPGKPIQESFRHALETHTRERMDGTFIARGEVITYQSLMHRDKGFWQRIADYRVFVIYDEIHHCSGTLNVQGNVWGDILNNQIEKSARLTLALSGTPWRSDTTPVTTIPYCSKAGNVSPSFVYGLEEAIADEVCRSPQLFIVDNDGIKVTDGGDNSVKRYGAIHEFVKQSVLPYQTLLNQPSLLFNLIELANRQLTKVRQLTPDAAGLVVASSIAHAKVIANLIRDQLNQDCILINSEVPQATRKLEEFRRGKTPWLVSVGMVSEGTDIPRLQVCCHLTRIKTELNFRQVLGRTLRYRNLKDEQCYMYMLADVQLTEFANRLSEELPNTTAVVNLNLPGSPDSSDLENGNSPPALDSQNGDATEESTATTESAQSTLAIEPTTLVGHGELKDNASAKTVSIYGKYWETMITLHDSKERLITAFGK